MTVKLKNIRPGVLIIADAKLRLDPRTEIVGDREILRMQRPREPAPELALRLRGQILNPAFVRFILSFRHKMRSHKMRKAVQDQRFGVHLSRLTVEVLEAFVIIIKIDHEVFIRNQRQALFSPNLIGDFDVIV